MLMELEENVSVQSFNTFGVDAKAKYFVTINREEDLRQLLALPLYYDFPRLILGGGSNMLFVEDFEGIVVYNNIKGIELAHEDEDYVWVKVGGGETWHQFVLHCVGHLWQGVENLSLIPGTVGAAPVQNIGAYGVEVQDVFDSLEAIDLDNGQISEFTRSACEFGYRKSIFKNELKGRYFITQVTFKLRKKPFFNTSYGAIESTLKSKGVGSLSIKAISDAVIDIRQSKLPDPAELGNAGSFFKNPEIPNQHFTQLKAKFPDLPGYPVDGGFTKVPAGWLIEQAGWKGVRHGNVGCHAQQALVIVNYGSATGHEICDFAMEVKRSVATKFGIELEPEVNLISNPI